MLIKNRFVKLLLVLLMIYAIWSLYIDIKTMCEDVDNEAIIPCLMYLPPLGFLALGILGLKLLESAVVIRLGKRIFRRKNISDPK